MEDEGHALQPPKDPQKILGAGVLRRYRGRDIFKWLLGIPTRILRKGGHRQ